MGCCGKKRKAVRTNGKLCPKCGWVMNRVHKFNPQTKTIEKYYQCTNIFKSSGTGVPCRYREPIK